MNATRKIIEEEVLIELLLAGQPKARGTVEVLCQHFAGKSGYGVFAPITNDCCGACRVAIAKVNLQRAKNGVFITCAHCARFLYLADKIGLENSAAPANPA